MGDWQPIETAPKDGSFIIAWMRKPWGRAEIVRWVDDAWYDRGEAHGYGELIPTHWMLLPEPPK